MDFFTYMLTVTMVVGAGFVFYGAFAKDKQAVSDNPGVFSLEEKLSSLETTVTEADEAANALDDMTKNVFKEFDDKYQALLFLYNLIDDKQRSLEKAETPSVSSPVASPRSATQADALHTAKKLGLNPKYDVVFELHSAGKSLDAIAKELNMGKGQVSLILNLGGVEDA